MTGQQLKNSILQMAVQGKLVPQDPNDEPASVLLERIRVEKEQLIKEGKIKKEKNPSVIFRGADNLPYEKIGKNEPVCIADEVPFEIPESWEWGRLSKIVDNRGQMTPAKDFCYIDISSIDNKLYQALIPVPPKAEQERIIKKLKNVLPYVVTYGIKYFEIESLNNDFPNRLKKSILQEAIQGKLVPQDPSDEPASVLMDRIRTEKERLIQEGKIKRDKHESIIFRRDNSHYEKCGSKEICIDDEIPFEIPETWEWERWGNISQSIQYGYNAPAKSNGRIKMVRISDIQDNNVLWQNVPFCEIKEKDVATYLLKPNDILFARTGGTVGKSYLVQDISEEAVYAGYLIRTRYSQLLCPQYLKCFMESELYWSQLRNGTIATAQPNCNGKTLGKMLLPIPPLAEQKRIVEKQKELFDKISFI